MLKSLWSIFFVEVRLARVFAGLLIGYAVIFGGFLLFLLAGMFFFVPTPSEVDFVEKLASSFLISTVLTSVLFFKLNGPIFAVGVFLASIWLLFAKRLNVLGLVCCLSVAALGFYFVSNQSADNLTLGSAIGEPLGRLGSIAVASWTDKMPTLFLNAFPLFVATLYVSFDPLYRKKNDL